MTVYKRGSIYWIEFEIRGHRVRESARTTDRKTAQSYERKRKLEIDNDFHAKRMGRTLDKTFRQAWERWEELGQAGPPSSMASHVKFVRGPLDAVKLVDIPGAADQLARKWLTAGLSPLTVNRRLALVKRVLNLAYSRWEWLAEPLHMRIHSFSERGTERQVFLTQEEVGKLYEAMKHPGARDALLVAVFTGLRRGELLALTPEHVRNGTILLRANETKGKKARAVPVHPAIEEILRERLPIGIRSAALNAHWDQARTACGLKHVRWHDLRHSFASWLAANPSVPLTEIRDLLGHSSLAITNKYAHLRVNSASVRALPTIVPQSILVEKATDEYPVTNQSVRMEARVGIEPAYTELQGNEEIVEVLDFMG